MAQFRQEPNREPEYLPSPHHNAVRLRQNGVPPTQAESQLSQRRLCQSDGRTPEAHEPQESTPESRPKNIYRETYWEAAAAAEVDDPVSPEVISWSTKTVAASEVD